MADGIFSKLKRLFRRETWDAERAREIQNYLETETAENIARGMSEEDAWFAARKKFGNPTYVREEIYHMNSLGFLEDLWNDLKYGARVLRLNPGFAIAAILSLALGIGANTAIFQLLDSVELKVLPVRDPQSLARVMIDPVRSPSGRSGTFTTRYPDLTFSLWNEIRAQQQGFSDIAAWAPEDFNLARGGEMRDAEGIWVSGDFFQTLGVQPLIGRLISESDDQRGCGASSAVVSYSFWQHEFGGAADVLGRSVYVDNVPFQIVGVTPASFFGVEVGRSYEIAVPMCAEPVVHADNPWSPSRKWWWISVIGRLKPGWMFEKASAQLRAISPQIFGDTLPSVYNAGDAKKYLAKVLMAVPADNGISDVRTSFTNPLYLLLALAGLVLLIACGNLANLLLARASAREKEIAVRLAIGASRRRLVQQLLAESFLLAFIGTGCGVLLAKWLSAFLVAYLRTATQGLFINLQTDWRVVGFAVGLALLTTVLFGLTPAMRGTSVPPGAVLKAAGRGNTATRERFGLRRALVVAQVGLSLVLLIGALLFARSLRNLLTQNIGMRESGVLVADLDFTRANLPAARRNPYRLELLDRVRQVPGVLSAASADVPPLLGGTENSTVLIGDAQESKDTSYVNFISDEYFKTTGTPILAGRDFTRSDNDQSQRVAIVNQAFVQEFFPGGNPLGKTFRFEEYVGRARPPMEIVGIVGNSKYADVREEFSPIAYRPIEQNPNADADAPLLIETNLPMNEMISSIKDAFGGITADMTFTSVRTAIDNSLIGDRMIALLSGFFGLLAGILAMIGLYGVMSYIVVRRRNEFGIRMALGAGRGQLIAMIMREAGILLGVGLVIGAILALASSRAAASLLYGLKPNDPVTIFAGVAVLSVVAAIASYIPAFRASRLDPMLALRDE
jgi:putative ABC transport system permease protein